MLVLSRKQGERIMVGNDVYITVVAIQSNQVRLGITAPMEVPVHREEVYQLMQQSGAANGAGQESERPPRPPRVGHPSARSSQRQCVLAL